MEWWKVLFVCAVLSHLEWRRCLEQQIIGGRESGSMLDESVGDLEIRWVFAVAALLGVAERVEVEESRCRL